MVGDPRFPDEVEFVLDAGDHDAADEELPQRAARPRPARRWAVLVAVALTGVAVAATVVRGSGSTPSTHSSDTPRTGSTVAVLARPVSGPQIAVRHEQTAIVRIPESASASASASTAAPRSPEPGPACSVAALAAGVLRALRTRFGAVVVDGSTSVLTGPTSGPLRLRTRTVVAHTGARSITVGVAPYQGTDRSQVTSGHAGSGVSVIATYVRRPWTVTVTVHDPRSVDADTATPSALAADPGLLAI